ncbi:MULTISPECIES: P22AR C-terminal domain-containing protein [unclassified Mannheimia]|uniref:P22AR C-terminal domain-containing protein n=1 Tax=unclassified Mannheimia TaxID=2645054 RepID=UPI00359D4166
MSNLQIFSNSIRTFENLYSLTDLHKASGGEAKHKPVLFLSNQQTKDLIAEIEQESKVGISTLAVKTVRGGKNPSTYACKEIVIAYAAWISPQFHLVVLRAFLNQLENLQKNTEIRPLAPPKPVEKIFNHNIINHEAVDLAWLWFEANHMAGFIKEITPALEALGSSYAPKAHSIAYEYGRHLHDIGKLVYRLTAEADFGHNPRPMRELESHFAKPTKSVRIAKF